MFQTCPVAFIQQTKTCNREKTIMADKNADISKCDENGLVPFTPAEGSGFAILMQQPLPHYRRQNHYVTIVIKDEAGRTTEVERIPDLTPIPV
jgi:hypothetical protein